VRFSRLRSAAQLLHDRRGLSWFWNRTFPSAGRTPDQQDAFAAVEWVQRADADGTLEKFFFLELEEHAHKTAEIEDWILGVV